MKTLSLRPVAETACAFAVLISSGHVSRARDLTGRRPNLVVIYADDLGYGDIQCYNRERGKIATPHTTSAAPIAAAWIIVPRTFRTAVGIHRRP